MKPSIRNSELLFELLGRPPKFKKMPIQMFDLIIPVMAQLAKIVPKLEDKAEFARIGYYCSESMLVLNTKTGEYDAEMTPSFGNDTLRDFYTLAQKGEEAGSSTRGMQIL